MTARPVGIERLPATVTRSAHPRFDFDVEPSSPYAIAGGVARYLGSRTTDGGRPAIYARTIGRHVEGCALLVGLGCGDSAVEHALQSALEPPIGRYIGVDVSGEMLALSQRRFAVGMCDATFMHADFTAPEVIEALAAALRGSRAGVITLVGRTFGNLDTDTAISALKPLARSGTLFLDFFVASDGAFEARMAEVARGSRDFFVAPLEASGCRIPKDAVEREFDADAISSVCSFGVTLGASEPAPWRGRYRLFTIRTFRLEPLLALLSAHGYATVLQDDLPDQILPMTLLGLRCA